MERTDWVDEGLDAAQVASAESAAKLRVDRLFANNVGP
jgi:hypothetical protein